MSVQSSRLGSAVGGSWQMWLVLVGRAGKMNAHESEYGRLESKWRLVRRGQ